MNPTIIKRTAKSAKTATHKTAVVDSGLGLCRRCAFGKDSDACADHPCYRPDYPEQNLRDGKTLIWVPRKRTLKAQLANEENQ